MEAVNFTLHIPEIVTHILMHIPVDSLWRMSCVSKQWRESVARVWQYIGLDTLVHKLEAIFENYDMVLCTFNSYLYE